jgi:hypothetical protein
MRLSIMLCLIVGCSEPIDERLEDYTTWKKVEVTGKAPGHADSYRVIYINDMAADAAQDFDMGAQPGSIIVKEIRKNDDGVAGDLNYIAIMRRIERRPISEPDGGWLFSRAEEPGGSEVHQDFCWTRCHVAAPFNGAWYDYRD